MIGDGANEQRKRGERMVKWAKHSGDEANPSVQVSTTFVLAVGDGTLSAIMPQAQLQQQYQQQQREEEDTR